jgi:hypothetical protein
VQCDDASTLPTCTGARRGTVASLVGALSSVSQSSVVSGLDPGTEYTCYVVAFNAEHQSTGVCSGPATATTTPA